MTREPIQAADRAPEVGRLPGFVFGRIWANLPVLLVADLVLTVAAVPALGLFLAGGEILVPLVAGLCLGPVWAATVAITDSLIRDGDASVRDLVRELARFGIRGVRLGGVAGAVGTIGLGTLTLYQANPEHGWLLLPLFVDGTVVTLTLLAGFFAFSLACTYGKRGWELLGCSLGMVAANPLVATGTVALCVLLGLVVQLVPSIVVVLPAMLATYLSAVVRFAHSQPDGGERAGTEPEGDPVSSDRLSGGQEDGAMPRTSASSSSERSQASRSGAEETTINSSAFASRTKPSR